MLNHIGECAYYYDGPCTCRTSDEALAELRNLLAGSPSPVVMLTDCEVNGCDEDAPGEMMLTVVFIDGRKVSVPVMVPTSGEAVVMRDGILLAEDRTMRCYSFPNVSHWWSEGI